MYRPPQYAYNYQWTPYFPSTPRAMTPFIPDPTLYPPSPYSNPGIPNRRAIPLPTDPTTPNTPNLELPPMSLWDGCRRERRPSWQGFGTNYFWPEAGQLYSNGAGVYRRHSFGATAYQPPYLGPGVRSPTSLFTPLFINPWINAESPRSDLFFDLSLSTFEPIQLSGDGRSRLLPWEEIMQPATCPFLTHLKIVFGEVPEWPCYLSRDPLQPPSPITLHDVLMNIHCHMHTQITMTDFVGLTPRGQAEVAEAFTKRCQVIPNNFVEERASGVKRVDYLLGKTRLTGLSHLGHEDGWDVMKVVVTRIRK